MSSNRLRLNPDKTEFIWIASPHLLKDIPQDALPVGASSISPSSSVRDLGAHLDNVLNLHSHVANISRMCFFELRQIRYIARCLSKSNIKSLLHAFVTSRLDYCNSLLAAQPISLTNKLQAIQNAAARLFAGVSRRSHVTSILRDELHWLRVPERINYKLCVLVYRCLNGLAPAYLAEYCLPLRNSVSRVSSNRSAARGNVIVCRTRTKTYGPRSFRVSGPSAWNCLPDHLKLPMSLSSFQSLLKTHFFQHSFS